MIYPARPVGASDSQTSTTFSSPGRQTISSAEISAAETPATLSAAQKKMRSMAGM
jgi:hypothetical protein